MIFEVQVLFWACLTPFVLLFRSFWIVDLFIFCNESNYNVKNT